VQEGKDGEGGKVDDGDESEDLERGNELSRHEPFYTTSLAHISSLHNLSRLLFRLLHVVSEIRGSGV